MSAPLLYLASKSPRRQALLQQLGIEFETLLLREAVGRDRDVVEEALDAEPPLHYVERIARTKAQVGWQRMQNRKLAERPVLGADTVVLGALSALRDAGKARPDQFLGGVDGEPEAVAEIKRGGSGRLSG